MLDIAMIDMEPAIEPHPRGREVQSWDWFSSQTDFHRTYGWWRFGCWSRLRA